MQPPSMGYRRRLLLIRLGESFLRLFSKPCGDGTPLGLGWRRTDDGLRWRPAAAGDGGAEGPRDLYVILLFVRGRSAKNLLPVSLSNVSVFVWVHVGFL